MMTLRCTQKLLARLRGVIDAEGEAAPTSVLGDWHATLLFTRPEQAILCVNDRSRLPLLVPARGLAGFGGRLEESLAILLDRLGAPERAVEREIAALRELRIARTRDRSVLGSINDFRFAYEHTHHLHPDWDLGEWSWRLAHTPCGPLKYAWPKEVALGLLGATR